MPSGDNKCATCGQWSGAGHVCDSKSEAEGGTDTLNMMASTDAVTDGFDFDAAEQSYGGLLQASSEGDAEAEADHACRLLARLSPDNARQVVYEGGSQDDPNMRIASWRDERGASIENTIVDRWEPDRMLGEALWSMSQRHQDLHSSIRDTDAKTIDLDACRGVPDPDNPGGYPRPHVG